MRKRRKLSDDEALHGRVGKALIDNGCVGVSVSAVVAVLDVIDDYHAFVDPEPAPSESSSGTCETWCGTGPNLNATHNCWADGKRCFCTIACRDAGRPLNPPGTQPTERGAK